MLTVADVFDALTADRVYRAAWPSERALALLDEGVGTAFDGACVAALRELSPPPRLAGRAHPAAPAAGRPGVPRATGRLTRAGCDARRMELADVARARRDPALVVLEGFHAVKHALRFGGELLGAWTADAGRAGGAERAARAGRRDRRAGRAGRASSPRSSRAHRWSRSPGDRVSRPGRAARPPRPRAGGAARGSPPPRQPRRLRARRRGGERGRRAHHGPPEPLASRRAARLGRPALRAAGGALGRGTHGRPAARSRSTPRASRSGPRRSRRAPCSPSAPSATGCRDALLGARRRPPGAADAPGRVQPEPGDGRLGRAVLAQRTPMRSTTKISVSSGPMTPPAPRLP